MLKNLGNFFSFIKVELVLALIFIFFRLPALGFDVINTDAPIWKTRIFVFSNALFSLDFAGTNVTYHPGVLLMWLGALGVKIYNFLARVFYGDLHPENVRDYVGLHFTQKLVLIIFLAFCLVIILYIVKKVYSKNFMFLFFAIFAFEPFVLGLTRVLHTDALITFTMLVSFLSCYYFYQTKNIWWLLLSGFFAGLAVLTKSNALFIFGIIGTSIFLLELLLYKNIKSFVFNIFKRYFLWLVTVCITFVILWPAMWVSPIATLQNYYSGIVNVGLESHLQAWMGVEVADPGPLFYPIVLFIRLTPLLMLFSGAGVLLMFYNFFKYKKLDKLLLLSLIFIVFYIFFLTLSDKKLGRYVLPTIPILGLFATYTLLNLLQVLRVVNYKLQIKTWFTFSGTVIVAFVIFLFSFFSSYKIFPDYYMYYSPLVGGFNGGSQIEEPKWPIGYSVLAKYLNALPGAESRYILVRYGYLYNPFNISGKTGTLSQTTEKDPKSYFILEKYSDWRYLKGKGVILKDVIKVGGVDYFWVYEIIGEYPQSRSYLYTFPIEMGVQYVQ